jgi:hypothetical protein
MNTAAARAPETTNGNGRFKIPVTATLLGLVFTVLSFIVGFSFHNGQMETKVAEHDVAIREKVNKDEFREFSKRMDQGVDSIQGQLKEIEQRLDKSDEERRHR